MQLIKYPAFADWKSLTVRPSFDMTSLFSIVNEVLDNVRTNGDKALLEYTEKFDKVSLTSMKVSDEEINEAKGLVSSDLKDAILLAKKNISLFHESQVFISKKIETSAGVICWQKSSPIEKVGLYVPGGTAPLFSTVLMLAIPAQIAGCRQIVLCTPPNAQGKIHPAILYAASIAGVTDIFKVGGSQAIAAMSYGTESIPKVYKIFGPGNQYVTAAKQLVSLKDVAIDMPAGPSEVLVIADETANPAFIAADLLSQAEHGNDSQSVLVTTDEQLVHDVTMQIDVQLFDLERKSYIEKSLQHSKIILFKTEQEVIDFTNEYAPEHLIIETKNYQDIADKITNAGSVFLGHYTPESAGDYASGTNHTLPTNGYAKAYSGVNLDSFIKKITFQEISKEGIQTIGPVVEVMAATEQLTAHKNAVTVRIQAGITNE